MGGVFGLLVLQTLLGSTGDSLLPTGWLGRLLALPGAESGKSYYWTTGAGLDARPIHAISLIALFALLTAAARALNKRASQS